MKKLIPAYILSFVVCFMLFFNEPLIMYATNKNDFGFDLYTIIVPLLVVFFSFFIVISLIFTGIYYLNKKLSKNLTFYNIVLVLSYILFFVLYIQGNYLIGNLPPLDGSMMNWVGYTKENIITFVILSIIVASYIITIKKYKFEKVINVSKYISLAVFGMLFVALLTTSISYNIFEKRTVLYISKDNMNSVSKNNNFYILLLDAVDSRAFNNAVIETGYNDLFDDFTYYPDTLSGYPFTRDSIPLILSGRFNENEMRFLDHYNKAMDESKLIERLKEYNYDINLYEQELKWTTDNFKTVSNAIEYKDMMSPVCFGKEELRYISYKYLPYFLKKYSKMDTFNFDYCKMTSTDTAYTDDNIENYKNFLDSKVYDIDNNYFSFIHLRGGHVPFDLDENVNRVEESTYEDMLKANIKIVDAFLNRLKENNIYDNSIIIVIADHGYKDGTPYGRQNPILYIKGLNEHHKMITSDKPISFVDLIDAYLELLDGKKSTELFNNIPQERTRRFLWYVTYGEDHIVEYIQTGKAWDESTLVKTGREFNR